MSLLADKRILVLEDEPIIAMALEDMLEALGCRVLGPAAWIPDALALVGEQPDAAILDVNINGGQSFPVAHALQEQGVPFLFATGYGDDGLSERFVDAHVLTKPYTIEDIERALAAVLDRSG